MGVRLTDGRLEDDGSLIVLGVSGAALGDHAGTMSSVRRRLVSCTAEPPAPQSRRKRGAAQRHEPLRSIAAAGAARPGAAR
jgi:hypothetical protein